MKKNYALLLATFCASLAWSQPVLNASDFQDFAVLGYSIEAEGLTPGPSGANQVWDFSSLSTLEEENFYINTVSPASAPFAGDFPGTNYAWQLGSAFFTNYQLFKVSSTQAEILGASDVSDSQIHTDTQIIFTFPYTYNNEITDTYQREADENPISNTITYDGYGTLITPFGTYNNVFRYKTVEGSDTDYSWFHANPFYPLLSGDFSDNYITIYKPVPLAVVSQVSDAALKIYPNPAKKEVYFLLENNLAIDKITITDVLGKRVLGQTGNISSINIESLPPGMYILEVYSGNQKTQSKLIKE